MQHLLALSGQDSLRRRGPESASGKGTEPGSDVDIEFDAFSRSRLFTMARQSYDLALNACDGMGSGEGLRRVAAMTKLTVKYNQARLQETLGESTKAVESYQDILTACPAYTDCECAGFWASTSAGFHWFFPIRPSASRCYLLRSGAVYRSGGPLQSSR